MTKAGGEGVVSIDQKVCHSIQKKKIGHQNGLIAKNNNKFIVIPLYYFHCCDFK